MSDVAVLHPLVSELMGDFAIEDGRLSLSSEAFGSWFERLRGLSPAQREPVSRDLVVLAARFQREAREATDWAVHALMFFAIELAGSIERAERIAAGQGLELSSEIRRASQAVEELKNAPPVRAGRGRSIDPGILAQHLARRR